MLRRQNGDQCDGGVANIEGALSTSHSTVIALPAISLNSTAGSLDRIKVAKVLLSVRGVKAERRQLTAKHDP